MTLREEGESASQLTNAFAPGFWIEVLAPVEIAGPLIVDALERSATLPVGIVIARTRYGSIVLNQRAWTFLHPMLTAIQGLRTRHAGSATAEVSAVDQEPTQIREIACPNSLDACDADSTRPSADDRGAPALAATRDEVGAPLVASE